MNRTVIAGSNGPINLIVPLVGGRDQKTSEAEVQVSLEQEWRRSHLRGIVSSYRKAPWFDHYYDSLAAFFEEEFSFLYQWNYASLEWVYQVLGRQDLNFEVALSKPQNAERIEESAQPLVPFSHQVLQEPPPSNQPYPQVFEDRFGFIPNLSVLDLIFCLGPSGARRYLIGD